MRASCLPTSTADVEDSVLSTPRVAERLAAPSARISEALPRSAAGFSERSFNAVEVRSEVAPAPTGSSAQGLPCVRAAAAARRMAVIHGGESVPMLITSAWAMETNSSTSSLACTIAGEAPTASSAFAVLFMTT
jgi:hypothetical protein